MSEVKSKAFLWFSGCRSSRIPLGWEAAIWRTNSFQRKRVVLAFIVIVTEACSVEMPYRNIPDAVSVVEYYSQRWPFHPPQCSPLDWVAMIYDNNNGLNFRSFDAVTSTFSNTETR